MRIDLSGASVDGKIISGSEVRRALLLSVERLLQISPSSGQAKQEYQLGSTLTLVPSTEPALKEVPIT